MLRNMTCTPGYQLVPEPSNNCPSLLPESSGLSMIVKCDDNQPGLSHVGIGVQSGLEILFSLPPRMAT